MSEPPSEAPLGPGPIDSGPSGEAPDDDKPAGPDRLEDQIDSAWIWDRIAKGVIFLGGISAIVFVLAIFLFVAKEGLSFAISELDLGYFFTSPNWRPTSEQDPTYGGLALIAGTASITGLAMLVAVPFALGSAVYIGEFATGKTRETLKVLVELLAATPSVVWGFIGMTIINPIIIDVFHVPSGLTVLNAGVILGLMAAPIMATIAEDALKAVPDSYREAAEAMGATRWQVIRQVVIPSAKNGLVAAILLGVGRGFGETMAVLMASGHSINIPTSLFDPARALTATIASELGETANGSDHYRVLFTLGIFLFLVTFVINLLADVLVRKGDKKRS